MRFWIICVLAFLLSTSVNAARLLKVGLLASLDGPASVYGPGRVITATWMIDQENSMPGGCIAKNGIQMELHVRNIHSDPLNIENSTRDLIHNVGVSFLVAAEGVMGVTSASIASERNVPVCVPMDGNDGSFVTTTGQRKNANVFATMTLASRYFSSFYTIAANHGSKRLAIIEATVPGFDTLVWMGSGSMADARDAGLEVVFSRQFEYTAGQVPTKEDEASRIDKFFGELVSTKPDVIAFATIHACDSFVSMTRKWKWRPKGAIVFECLNNWQTLDPSIIDELRGVFVPAQWHPDLKGREYSDEPDRDFASLFPFRSGENSITSARQVYSKIGSLFAQATPPFKWHSLVPADMACYYSLFSGACVSNSTDPSQLRMGVHATFIPTAFGPQAYSTRLGINPLKKMATLQLKWSTDPNATAELAPATDSDYVPFWGLPSLSQLKQDRGIIGKSYEHSLLSVYVLEMIVIACVMFAMVAYSDNRYIKGMSIPLSLLHLLGSAVVIQSVLVFGFNANDDTCRARWTMLVLGMTLSTTPLSLKLFRVARIMYHRQFNTALIPMNLLFGVLGAACLVFTGTVALMSCMEGQTSTRVVMVDLFDRSSWYSECVYELDSVQLVAGIMCIAQIAIAFGLAVYARKVPKTLSAAFGTILAVYTDMFLVVMFALFSALDLDRQSASILQCCILLVFPVANIVPLYAYPLHHAIVGKDIAMIDLEIGTLQHTKIDTDVELQSPNGGQRQARSSNEPKRLSVDPRNEDAPTNTSANVKYAWNST